MTIYTRSQIKNHFNLLIKQGLSETDAIEQTASYFIASPETVAEIVGIETNEME